MFMLLQNLEFALSLLCQYQLCGYAHYVCGMSCYKIQNLHYPSCVTSYVDMHIMCVECIVSELGETASSAQPVKVEVKPDPCIHNTPGTPWFDVKPGQCQRWMVGRYFVVSHPDHPQCIYQMAPSCRRHVTQKQPNYVQAA